MLCILKKLCKTQIAIRIVLTFFVDKFIGVCNIRNVDVISPKAFSTSLRAQDIRYL